MSLLRAIICILCPPAAVIDRGGGAALIVGIFTLLGWIPGVLIAVFFISRSAPQDLRAGDRAVIFCFFAILCGSGVAALAAFTFARTAITANSAVLTRTFEETLSRGIPAAPSHQPANIQVGQQYRLTCDITIPLQHGTTILKGGAIVTVMATDNGRARIRSGRYTTTVEADILSAK